MIIQDDPEPRDERRLVGYAAYRVNNACIPGSPYWRDEITKEALSSIAESFGEIYQTSPEEAWAAPLPYTVVRVGEADLVTGSQDAMRRFLEGHGEALEDFTILPVYFGEIILGMGMDGVYGLDRKAYDRFYPLAVNSGCQVALAQF